MMLKGINPPSPNQTFSTDMTALIVLIYRCLVKDLGQTCDMDFNVSLNAHAHFYNEILDFFFFCEI